MRLTKEQIIKYLTKLKDEDTYHDKVYELFHGFPDSILGSSVIELMSNCIATTNEHIPDVQDLIEWWLYETVDKIVWDDTRTDDINDINDFADFLLTNY